jgi:histidinol-phosphate aminotransferase
MTLSVPDYILAIDPYKPGKPLEELEREYGIADSIKLASNENPLGPSPKALAAIRKSLDDLHRYPDGGAHLLTGKLARKLGLLPQNIVLGNGSDELIGMLTRALLRPGDEAVMPRPSFLMYEIMVRSAGAVPVFVPLTADLALDLEGVARQVSSRTRMIFLCNPNNPTGTVFSGSGFETLLEQLPSGVTVVVDEAYIEFVRDPGCARGTDYLDARSAVVTLRTFSKAYGLAGLRIGYGVMPAALAGILHRIRLPFNAGSLAQAGAGAALDDDGFLSRTIHLVHEQLDQLFEALGELGLRCFPTQSNFFLIDVESDADTVFERMLRRGVIVRSMSAYGYPFYIRVNVGLPQENRRFVTTLREVLQELRAAGVSGAAAPLRKTP